ncbi:hypothetical protein ACFZDK_49890 [Streptomyces sp. NPDC007901]|uniref:hypothetical protein n=1 Tax=Streptomyces sp. NPDC007901 TaxID=3364785 RepID=UPI0036E41BE0
MQGQHPTITDFTDGEFDEYCSLITKLLTGCKDVIDKHGPQGSWTPASPERRAQVVEAMGVLADLSRALNGTRNGLRRLDSRVRLRLTAQEAQP